MRLTKRVILAEGSNLLREALQRVINQAGHLEVVKEVADKKDLPSAIARFDPEWVIVSSPLRSRARNWERCITDHPSVRFMFLSPHSHDVILRWQGSCEAEYSNLSLQDFLDILEKDLQHT